MKIYQDLVFRFFLLFFHLPYLLPQLLLLLFQRFQLYHQAWQHVQTRRMQQQAQDIQAIESGQAGYTPVTEGGLNYWTKNKEREREVSA